MSKSDLLYIENDWKELTNLGNNLILQTTQIALSKYKLALEKAEKLMEYQKECINHQIPVMPIFLISCNNLAEVHCLLKNWKKADKMLKRGVYYILHLNKQQMNLETESVLSKWLFKQMLLFKEFSERSNQPEKYKELLQQLKDDIYNFSVIEE